MLRATSSEVPRKSVSCRSRRLSRRPRSAPRWLKASSGSSTSETCGGKRRRSHCRTLSQSFRNCSHGASFELRSSRLMLSASSCPPRAAFMRSNRSSRLLLASAQSVTLLTSESSLVSPAARVFPRICALPNASRSLAPAASAGARPSVSFFSAASDKVSARVACFKCSSRRATSLSKARSSSSADSSVLLRCSSAPTAALKACSERSSTCSSVSSSAARFLCAATASFSAVAF